MVKQRIVACERHSFGEDGRKLRVFLVASLKIVSPKSSYVVKDKNFRPFDKVCERVNARRPGIPVTGRRVWKKRGEGFAIIGY